MAAENGASYQPVTDLEASRKKLTEIAETKLEVPPEVLGQCIQDVLAMGTLPAKS